MYNRKDGYYNKAKKEGYASRAAYKLKELNEKYKIIRKNNTVLDAGCAPGGWLKVISEIVGPNGIVIGVDVLDVKSVSQKNIIFIKGDFSEQETMNEILKYSQNFDVVVSDIAPNTTGQRIVDHTNSLDLVKKVFSFSKQVLKDRGNFLFKLFDGEDRESFTSELKQYFDSVKIIRPDATRKNSFEIYVVCTGFRNDNT